MACTRCINAFLALSVVVCASVSANLSVFDVFTGQGPQSYPAISGTTVVWVEQFGDSSRIFIKDADDTLKAPDMIGQFPGDAFPDYDGRFIVWHSDGDVNHDIWCYDTLSIIAANPFAAASSTNVQKFPAVSNGIIVWQEYAYVSEIWMAQIRDDLFEATKVLIETDPNCYDPDVSESLIVWEDARDGAENRDIRGYDFAANSEIVICEAGGVQENPAVFGRNAVWADSRSGNADIYLRNVDTELEVPVCLADGDQNAPAVCGRWIAWHDGRSGTYQVYMYDVESFRTYQAKPSSQAQTNPALSSELICWQENGLIKAAVLPDASGLELTSPAGGETLIAGFEHLVTWQSSLPDGHTVNIEYSDDLGITWHSAVAGVEDTGQWLWQDIPSAGGEKRILRVIDADSDYNADAGGLFEVVDCDPALTADANGDCVVDLTDFSDLAAQWQQTGY
jgi:beta propeller repeat protein